MTAFEGLAERDVEFVHGDGRVLQVRLRIGRPYPSGEGDWCRPVAAEGWRRLGPIVGIDSWQALMLTRRSLEGLACSAPRSSTEPPCTGQVTRGSGSV